MYSVKEIFYTLQGRARKRTRPVLLPLAAAIYVGREPTGFGNLPVLRHRFCRHQRPGGGKFTLLPICLRCDGSVPVDAEGTRFVVCTAASRCYR